MFSEGISPHPRHASTEFEISNLLLNHIELLAISDPELVVAAREMGKNILTMTILDLISDINTKDTHA